MSTLKDILEQRGMGGRPCCPGCGMRMRMQQGNCPDCGVKYGLGMGAADAPGMSEAKTEEEPTTDFKLDKTGKKIKASKIIFNQGEDDSTKKVQENMKPTFKDIITALTQIRSESLQREDQRNQELDEKTAPWETDAEASKREKEESNFKKPNNPTRAGMETARALAQKGLKKAKTNEEVDESTVPEHMKSKQKPYVSSDGKGGYEVLGNQGQVKATFSQKEHGKDARNMARAHVQKHYDTYLKEEDMNEELHPDADKVLKHIKPEHHAKYTPDLTTKHYTGNYADRTAVLKAAERAGHLKESAFDWKNAPREKWDKTKTATYHDVKKISTGTVYTKQFDKDGTSKGSGDDAAKKAEGAVKRGRGRPKKDKFAESVEMLMSLSEDQFDSMMEEGFDAFFEAYEQIDELSKDTLKTYIKHAAHSAANKGAEFGSRHAAADEVDRFTNRHMRDQFANRDKMKAMVGASHKEVQAPLNKANKRVAGIKQAVDKLTK